MSTDRHLQQIVDLLSRTRLLVSDEKRAQEDIGAEIPGEVSCFVYGLRFSKPGHPYDGLIRYVGKTLHLSRRFRRHMKAMESDTSRLARCVRKHGAECFSIEILAEFTASSKRMAEKLAFAGEIESISNLGTAEAPHGLNMTTGGEGISLVGEAKERHLRAAGLSLNKVKRRPEVREKLRDIALARANDARERNIPMPLHSSESIARRSATLKQKYRDDPDHRAKRDETLALARSSQKWKDGSRQRIVAYATDPVNQERMRHRMTETSRSPEARAKKSKIALDLHQDAEFSKRYRQGIERRYADAELREAHARKTRDRHSDPGMARSAKIGIALHWAIRHDLSGNAQAAMVQRRKIADLLAECCGSPNERRIAKKAQAYLEKSA